MNSETDRRPIASVVITTRDRPRLFEAALQSVLSQSIECELVVIDDGPENQGGDVGDLCAGMDSVKYFRNESSVGIIQARNQAFRHAEGEFVFTLDDDAVFADEQLVENVCHQFSDPEVGAVTIPLTDHLPDGTSRHRLAKIPGPEEFYCVPIFSGGANAIRASLIDELGGYRGSGRQGEERDFSLRMLDRGYLVRVASDCKIDHYPQHSGGRAPRIFRDNVRANVEWAWRSVPFPQNGFRMVGSWLLQTGQLGLDRDWMDPHIGLCQGLLSSIRGFSTRRPVRRATYAAFRRMSKKGFSKREVYVEIADRVGLRLRVSDSFEAGGL